MPGPYDYGSIMASGQRLVPDLRHQMMEEQMLDIQAGQAETQRAATALRIAEAQREAREAENFQRDLDAALMDGRPEAIQRLMMRYPEMADGIKPAWEAMDADQRQRDLTQTGTIYARGQAGDVAGAANALRERIEADRAGGAADPADEAILAGLESGDPIQERAALATIGIQLAALTGDKFSETYGRLNPTEATPPIQREAEYYRSIGRDDLAELALENRADPVVVGEPGAPIYRSSDFSKGGAPAQPRGGDPSTSAGFAMPVQGGTFGDGLGAPRDGGARSHNGLDIQAPAGTPVTPVKPGQVVSVGSDPKSGLFVRVRHSDGSVSSYAHLGRQDVEVGAQVGPQTQLGVVGATGNASGNVLHFVLRDPRGRLIDPRPLLGVPRQIRSRQEYDRLAPGTPYIAPDGSQRVKG